MNTKVINFSSNLILPTIGIFFYYLICAAEPAVLAVLYSYGESLLVDKHNPITYCNILVISNIVCTISFALLYPEDLKKEVFVKISSRQWILLACVVIVSNIVMQGLYFAAIRYASIADIVLISSFQIPLGAAIAAFFFAEKIGRRQIFGQVLIIGGIFSAFLLTYGYEGEFDFFSLGYLLAFGAMLARLATTFLSKEVSTMPLGIIGVVAHIAGTIVFGTIAIFYYGVGHFYDLLLPEIWEIVVIYAVFFVLARRILKYASFRHNSRQSILAFSATYPIIAISAAALIAEQELNFGQVLGIAAITLGMLLAADWHKRKSAIPETEQSKTKINQLIRCNG